MQLFIKKTGGIMSIDINNLTLGQIKEIKNLLPSNNEFLSEEKPHLMIGRRCIIRTYSAGVHIGDVSYANGMEVKLENALRLWKWEGGGLSLSAVANNGIKGGRLNRTGEVYLTNVVEMIPTTERAEKTYEKFIEDDEK